MGNGQGSLEYLVIITIAITITAIIVLLAVNYFGGQQEQYYYNSCRQAASTCKMTLSVNPSDPCASCDISCNYSDGTEIFVGAAKCCKEGDTDAIYTGSLECGAPACTGSQTQICTTVDGCAGTETCSSGAWGACVKDDPNCPAACTPPATLPCTTSDGCPGEKSCQAGGTWGACVKDDSACPSPGTFTKIPVADVGAGAGPLAIANVNGIASLDEIIVGVGLNTYSVWFKDADAVDVYTCSGASCNGGRAIDKTFTSLAVGNTNNLPPNEIILGAGDLSLNRWISLYSFGSGGWTTSFIEKTGRVSFPTALTVGDADDNGLADVIAYDNSDRNLVMFTFNALSGIWAEETVSTDAGIGVNRCRIGDVVAAPGNEVVCVGYISAKVFKKTSSWAPHSTIPTPGNIFSLAIGDVDNDGSNEVAIGRGTPGLSDIGTELQVFKFNEGSSTWQSIYDKDYGCGGGVSIVGLAIGDVDLLPGNELIVGVSSQGCAVSQNALEMHKISGTTPTVSKIDAAPGDIQEVIIGDANNIGKDDVVMARIDTGTDVFIYTTD